LNADACQIFTDVDGAFTCDPRVVGDAQKLDEIAYDELLEMAGAGSKVMQSRAVEFAKKFGVEFEVRSSFKRDAGTIADPGSVKIGQTLKITTQATLTAPAVFAPNVTTDTACDGIAIYGVTTNGANANIAVLTRNAEVNANLLYYPGTITGADKLAIARALAAHNIMVRS